MMKPRREPFSSSSLASSHRRQAKGRNSKRHQQPRDPRGNVFLHKQHQDTQQPQHRCEDGEQTSGKTQQEREHGHKQGQHQHKGSGKDFEYDPHRGFLLFPVYVYYNSEKIGTQGCPGPPHFWSRRHKLRFAPLSASGQNPHTPLRLLFPQSQMTLWEPFYPEAGTAGERRGAVPPCVTSLQWRRAGPANQTAAPTGQHSPFADVSAHPGTGRRSCWHGWPPD